MLAVRMFAPAVARSTRGISMNARTNHVMPP
jgi:hypothetical protein